jgi:hypothetical protein
MMESNPLTVERGAATPPKLAGLFDPLTVPYWCRFAITPDLMPAWSDFPDNPFFAVLSMVTCQFVDGLSSVEALTIIGSGLDR